MSLCWWGISLFMASLRPLTDWSVETSLGEQQHTRYSFGFSTKPGDN